MKRTITTFALAALFVAAPLQARAQSHAKAKDIVTTVVEAGSFTTLATALQAAGLVDVLKGNGPFTVFAPTDEAFAQLPAGTLEALLADKEALTRVLTFHVVPGRVTSGDVVKLSSAPTVAEVPAPIEVRDGAVYVAGARVTTADIEASNGVIHVVDRVMIPPQN
ncbi:MAG: fasciclin domain-containing protein [Gemmatimonadetes bacterium]|nr:MAG: fasciclin domain-containing protein [Gemmatimonadota bacterium]